MKRTGVKFSNWKKNKWHNIVWYGSIADSPTGVRIVVHHELWKSPPAGIGNYISLMVGSTALREKMRSEIKLREQNENNLPKETWNLIRRGDSNPKAWAWTTVAPPSGWFLPNFNDSSWKRSAGGFGSDSFRRRQKVSTEWKTDVIWLRRHFQCSVQVKKVINAEIDIYHDDDVHIYLNGVPLLCEYGWSKEWKKYIIPKERLAAALKKGDNVIAVKAMSPDKNGNYIDFGLSANVAK